MFRQLLLTLCNTHLMCSITHMYVRQTDQPQTEVDAKTLACVKAIIFRATPNANRSLWIYDDWGMSSEIEGWIFSFPVLEKLLSVFDDQVWHCWLMPAHDKASHLHARGWPCHYSLKLN